MQTFWRCALELSVSVPGMLLAYLPVSAYLRQRPRRLAAWMLPLLVGLCAAGSLACGYWGLSTVAVVLISMPVLMGLYMHTLRLSFWKTGSVALSVYAVFACLNSISRGIDAIIHPATADPLLLSAAAGILYCLLCWAFVLLAWHPAANAAKTLVEDDNFAQTWYVFWVLPLVFIGLNLFMVPRYPGTLQTGRILPCYIVVSSTLLVLLVLFYGVFFMMATSLNRNAKLQQENHFLSMQQARYENLQASMDEARQARHDLRHHFTRLSAMAQEGQLEEIKRYLYAATSRIPSLDIRFCDNGPVDSVIGYYCSLARREDIPFHARIDLPETLPVDEIDMCLVLSNLLENAQEASLRTAPQSRQIDVAAYLHSSRIVLIQVTNAFGGEIREKQGVFQSSKRRGSGVGIQSVRRIAEKSGGASSFTHQDGIFTAKVMLRGES